ncbi:YciI family protein [Sphingomonas canadensis]|uniref:YciI family protein n=1 Tax=Sphingomonas canadensis TaxID=1219257 RepID=A0ABW3H5X4_9SPHN|nr:YciI family protein [Sphingomonas canadensis]MCW3836441.1 YciI family protein [Sphingomonas canadensis]
MIVATVRYLAAPEAVAALREPHVEWLKDAIAEGRVLAAGRQVPPVGGMILARGTIDAVRAWSATDPFVTGGVAEYLLTEVAVTLVAPGLETLAP